MKSTLRQFILLTTFTLLYVSIGQSADLKSIFNSAKKAVGGDSSISTDEMVQGLKEALTIGTQNAVATVSKADGYYNNPDIKIPLPEEIEKAGKFLRLAGYGPKIDEFEQSMNRAAEQAAPEAKQIFLGAVNEMKIQDAQKILDGPDNAATNYFKDKTYSRLQEIFKPIVTDTMGQVGVTRQFQDINNKLSSIPLADKASVDLDQYVTDKSLDGLFFMLAEEEKKIRQDPAARVTDILKKVFGSSG
ncbi:MAG: DUF4197 domain-containing protein [Desulfobacteraceae bacterium]|jgi:hypothetical protein|nr:DUF4197 domain-containing protein [Desulfobacteraceae bacterium]